MDWAHAIHSFQNRITFTLGCKCVTDSSKYIVGKLMWVLMHIAGVTGFYGKEKDLNRCGI